MSKLGVRPATTEDADALVKLWHPIMQERAQFDRRLKLSTDAPTLWKKELQAWLNREDVAVFVAQNEEKLVGYVVGWILERPIFLLQERYGYISDLGVDGHAHLGGIGTVLFDAIKSWFREQGIERIDIQVMHCHPIAQAFWRAKGATQYMDHFWYKLPSDK
jgi:ribosomal protein S18 acetylase RimI-like enzyme